MLETLDTVIAFAVIMTVVSLLVTTLVQMASSALALRGKNLANALSLTFQTIDPRLGEQAHTLAAQILRDPIFSDSLFAPKSRTKVGPANPALLPVIAAERALTQARDNLAAAPADPALPAAVAAAEANLAQANAALPQGTAVPISVPVRQHDKPWTFLAAGGSMTLATAVRPGEIYRLLHEMSDLTPTEARLRGFPADLTNRAAELLRALGVPDQPTAEAQAKLQAVVNVANLFTTAEEKKAVLDSLGNFGSAVERATTQSYDRFQRWFGSAQDRAEQWFQVHVRGITIFFAVVVAFLLQLDTIDIFHQLRSQPVLVAALAKAAPGVLAQEPAGVTAPTEPLTDAQRKAQLELEAQKVRDLAQTFDQTGFDLVPQDFLGRWGHPRRAHLFDHFWGIVITSVLLTLGAPFWFNLLKNLMNLRPAVATLIERRPQSAPALPSAPATPSAAS